MFSHRSSLPLIPCLDSTPQFPNRASIRIAPSEGAEEEWPPDLIFDDSTIVKFFGMGLTSEPTLAKYWEEIQNS